MERRSRLVDLESASLKTRSAGCVAWRRGAAKPLPAAVGFVIVAGLVLASYLGFLPGSGSASPAGRGGAPAGGGGGAGTVDGTGAGAGAGTGAGAGAGTQKPVAGGEASRLDGAAVKPAKSAVVPVPMPTSEKATETLRIGTWNIEWLGKPMDRSGLGQGIAQTAVDIADYIGFANVDVLALQEISPQGAAGRANSPTSPELDAVFAELKSRTKATWRYVLVPGRNEGDQLCGIAWNTAKVNAVDGAGKLFAAGQERATKLAVKGGRSGQGSGLWNRPPHAMKFSAGAGKTDFVLCVLHMKADYQGDFAAHRGEEAVALVAALPRMKQEMKDEDIVLLGDTNMTASGSNPEVTEKTLVAAGFVDVNAKAEQTHWRGGATDRIFVPVGQREFAGHTLEIMSDRWLEAKRWTAKDFKRRLSDHYMVVTTIAVGGDDD